MRYSNSCRTLGRGWLLLLAGLLAVGLTACGTKSDDKSSGAEADNKPDATGQPQNIKQGTTPGGG